MRRFERFTKGSETRANYWIVGGMALVAVLWLTGCDLETALLRGLGCGVGSHLIDYGVCAGVVQQRITQSNRGVPGRSAYYTGRAAIVFGGATALGGMALILGAMWLSTLT